MPPKTRYRQPFRPSVLRRWVLKAVHYGSRRYCGVCRSSVRRFGPYGHIVRPDVCCPVCGCVERHRFTWHFFERRTDLFKGEPIRMLHVAPEPAFEPQLRAMRHIDYLTVDAQDANADMCVDLHALPFADNSFDVVHCSHVLEHVRDDRVCIREIARVLAPGGWATILVPMIADQSHEDPRVTDPDERARRYGQWDHVRAYGPDFIDRLTAGGLAVTKVSAADLAPNPLTQQRERLADEELFFCRTIAGNQPSSSATSG